MSHEPGIEVRLDRILSERDMTVVELAERVGVTYANLSVLKNNRARAIRFSTLTRLCAVLECQPGDILAFVEPGSAALGPAGTHSGW